MHLPHGLLLRQRLHKLPEIPIVSEFQQGVVSCGIGYVFVRERVGTSIKGLLEMGLSGFRIPASAQAWLY